MQNDLKMIESFFKGMPDSFLFSKEFLHRQSGQLGMYEKLNPKFVRKYMNLSEDIVNSVENYKKDIKSGIFPAQENWFSMDSEELKKLREGIGR